MKGLFAADRIYLRRWLPSFLLIIIYEIIAVYTIEPSDYSNFYASCMVIGIVSASAIPVSRMQENINRFSAIRMIFPVSRKQMVHQEYLITGFMLFGNVILNLLYFATVLILGCFYPVPKAETADIMIGIFYSSSSFLLVSAVAIPVSKLVKNMVSMTITFGLTGGLVGFSFGFATGYFEDMPVDRYFSDVIIFLVISLIFYIISYIISWLIAKHKEY